MSAPHASSLPLLGFAAYSGTGKTSLLVKLLPLFTARGLRVGVIKHAHHDFDIDHPGKDSYALRKAGARQMLVASNRRWALMVEHETAQEPELAQLLTHLDYTALDLILVEGFKHAAFPKIELHRHELSHPLLFPEDATIIAVACDGPLPVRPTPVRPTIAQLDINNEHAIFNFIVNYFSLPL